LEASQNCKERNLMEKHETKKKLEEDNYLIIDNFIPLEEAKFFYQQFKNLSVEAPELFHKDSQCPLSLAMYDYKWFVHLLLARLPLMNEIMQEIMLPTYSYARLYANGDELKKHKDRPACEVSVTLHLGSDGTPWPISFTKPNNEIVSYSLKEGQAAIYLGMVSEHWREKFEGDEYVQVFLHYVRFNGEHWDRYFDKKR
jgi:hypothetical protein